MQRRFVIAAAHVILLPLPPKSRASGAQKTTPLLADAVSSEVAANVLALLRIFS
jgi:hypothetical protein